MGEDASGSLGRGVREMVLWRCSRYGGEVKTERTPGPSDVAEERMRACGAQWGHDLSMVRLLEKRGPALYSPECVEEEFSEVRIAPIQHPCPLAEVLGLRGLASLLGA
jgi:hypothetical protein